MFVSSSLLTKILVGALVGILIIGGVVGSRIFFLSNTSTNETPQGALQAVPATTVSTSVLEERIRNLETSLAEVINVLKTTTGKTINTPAQVSTLDSRVKTLETSVADLQVRVKALESGSKTTATTTSTSTKSPTYIPLRWNNSTTSTEWGSVGSTEVSIAGADYPGYTSMVLEVSIKSSTSGNRAYARIFNKDDNSAVSASEASTDVAAFTLGTSSGFTLPSTRKTYYLQMKSASGVGAQIQDASIRVNY